jgi:hypothetical protein
VKRPPPYDSEDRRLVSLMFGILIGVILVRCLEVMAAWTR